MNFRTSPFVFFIFSILLSGTTAADEQSYLQSLCSAPALSAARQTIQKAPLWHILCAQREAIEQLREEPSQTQLRVDNQLLFHTLPLVYGLVFDAQNQSLHEIQEPLNAILQTSYTCQMRITPALTQLLEDVESVTLQATLICPQTKREFATRDALYAIVAALRHLLLHAALTEKMVTLSSRDDASATPAPTDGIPKEDLAELTAQFKVMARHLQATGAYDQWEREKKKDSWFKTMLKVVAVAGVIYTAYRWWQKSKKSPPPPAPPTPETTQSTPVREVPPTLADFNRSHPRDGEDTLRDMSLRIGCGHRPLYTADDDYVGIPRGSFWKPHIEKTAEGEAPSCYGPAYQAWCKQLMIEVNRRTMAVLTDVRALALWTQRCCETLRGDKTARDYLFNTMMADNNSSYANTSSMQPRTAEDQCTASGVRALSFSPYFHPLIMRLVHISGPTIPNVTTSTEEEYEALEWRYDPIGRFGRCENSNYHVSQEENPWIQSLQTVQELEQALPTQSGQPLNFSAILPVPERIEHYFQSLPTCVLREYYGEEPPPHDTSERRRFASRKAADSIVTLADAYLLAREKQIEPTMDNLTLPNGYLDLRAFDEAQSEIAEWLIKEYPKRLFAARKIDEAPYNDGRPPVMNPNFRTVLRVILANNPSRH